MNTIKSQTGRGNYMWGSMPNIHDNQNHQPVHNMSMSNGFYEQYQTNGQPMSSQPSSTFQMQYYQLEGSFLP